MNVLSWLAMGPLFRSEHKHFKRICRTAFVFGVHWGSNSTMYVNQRIAVFCALRFFFI